MKISPRSHGILEDNGSQIILWILKKLKKGEMKVTVIATGFPTDMPKRSLFQMGQSRAIDQATTPDKEDTSKDKEKDKNGANSDYIKKGEKEKVDDDLFIDDTDDWSTVPAFLRRNKK